MRLSRLPVACVLLLGFATVVVAEIKLPAIIGSNMVLQRDEKVPIWGWSKPGTEVHVVFDKKALKATTDTEGRWQVLLGPLTASKQPKTMVIETNHGDRRQLDNILVGEVWLCSGQSNMERPMKKTFESEKEIAEAQYPRLRLFQVNNATSPHPLEDCTGKWVECTPENVENFSAVGYYFGRILLEDLDVPVGMVGPPSIKSFSRR